MDLRPARSQRLGKSVPAHSRRQPNIAEHNFGRERACLLEALFPGVRHRNIMPRELEHEP